MRWGKGRTYFSPPFPLLEVGGSFYLKPHPPLLTPPPMYLIAMIKPFNLQVYIHPIVHHVLVMKAHVSSIQNIGCWQLGKWCTEQLFRSLHILLLRSWSSGILRQRYVTRSLQICSALKRLYSFMTFTYTSTPHVTLKSFVAWPMLARQTTWIQKKNIQNPKNIKNIKIWDLSWCILRNI